MIEKLLLEERVDLSKLRAVSRQPGGFLTNELRRRVWPKLLGVNRYDLVDYRVYVDPHRDDSQVRMDVDRSLWSFHHTKQWSTAHRENRRNALCNVITAILCRHAQLYYYQGFHDAVSVFLLVVEEDRLAFALAERVALHYFRDCMHQDFHLVSKLTPLLFRIVASADSELAAFFQQASLEPYFAMSWLLTWFAHDVKDVQAAARIYDCMLCSAPCFSLYLSAAYILQPRLRQDILSSECDFATLHNLLVHAPSTHGVPFEELLPQADALFERCPPASLALMLTGGEARIAGGSWMAGRCGVAGGAVDEVDEKIRRLVASKRVVMLRPEPFLSISLSQSQSQSLPTKCPSVAADWVLLRRQHLRNLQQQQQQQQHQLVQANGEGVPHLADCAVLGWSHNAANQSQSRGQAQWGWCLSDSDSDRHDDTVNELLPDNTTESEMWSLGNGRGRGRGRGREKEKEKEEAQTGVVVGVGQGEAKSKQRVWALLVGAVAAAGSAVVAGVWIKLQLSPAGL